MNNIIRFGVSIDEKLLTRFDSLIGEKGYVNRSEAIRDLIRTMMVNNDISDPEAEAIGTLTLVYDHHVHEISDKLNDIQHHYFGSIVSTTHIHLDEHNCLEVLILRGKTKDVQAIADKLASIKNIRNGQLTLTSAEK
ncbi:MAG: nickel-responsive transcriptional regulator NikR [bacterium]|nr:nickel-responsive transcriptional regulator NikR [bacterium]